MRRGRNAAARLRNAVEMLPVETKSAMLLGLEQETIITGAYTHDGGVCPMLAAHRRGVRSICLRRPDRVEAERLRFAHEFQLLVSGQAQSPVADVQPQPHRASFLSVARSRVEGPDDPTYSARGIL